MIAAMGKDRVIGKDNRLPWRLPADLRRFREVTTGHTIVMGRRTFESIGRPLPRRTNIVLTRDRQFCREGCGVVHTIDEILDLDTGADEIMIIGGAQLYRQMLTYASTLYLSCIDHSFDGDQFFPVLNDAEWLEQTREIFPADRDNLYSFDFVTLKRRANPAR